MGEERGPISHYGLIAWIMTVLAIISVLFIILDWTNVSDVMIVYALELSFGLGGAAMMGVNITDSLTDTRGQAEVLIYGLLGGSALMMISQVLYVFWQVTAFAAVGNAGLVVLAPVAETLVFEFILFGTFWLLGEKLGIIKWLRFLITAIPSSMIFALWHYWTNPSLHLLPLIVLFLGSLLLKAIYAKTDDVGTPMLAHLFNNVFAVMGLIAVVISTYWWVLGIPVILLVLYLLLSKGGPLK